ncbi:MFS transporter [Bradyrhizobium sp. ARR65]|uniref:MFS transporter n=1 Tax=Bradyrhizobium sp. ARR65 TaxID=1040989 RepID=UPI001FD97BCA|nr:MFS transporter [Bradyrhizobium sp. ARR65]
MFTTAQSPLETENAKIGTLLLAGLGGALENYDFVIFALFARVLAHIFFPPGIPEWLTLIQTFGIFAAGNLVRPVGGIVLAHYGDLLGRKRTFLFSILLMAIATLGIACTPTYASIGIGAPIVLLLFRILQGAAMGGEMPGAWTFVAEHVARRHLGFACGVLTSALAIGNLLGALAGILINRLYQPAEILAFAWRLPFLAGGILALLSVYLRRWLVETPIFKELQASKELAVELPLKIVLRGHRGSILSSAALTLLLAVTIIVVFAMTPTLLQTRYGIDAETSFEATSLATTCLAASCVGFGILADLLGVGMFFVLGAPFLAACTYSLYALLPGHPERLFPLYALVGLSAGVVSGVPWALVQSFPPLVRFSGVAFSYNVAYAICSGVTPPLITLALRVDPLAHAHAVLLACAVAFLSGAVRLCLGTRQTA